MIREVQAEFNKPCSELESGSVIKFQHYQPLGKVIYISWLELHLKEANQETFKAHIPICSLPPGEYLHLGVI